MPGVEVVIPFRGGCDYRERALRFVQARYARQHPDWTVTIAPAPPGSWIKANAVTPAVRASTADIVIVADADVWCDHLTLAVSHCFTWAIPHTSVHRLSKEGSDTYMDGGSDPYALPVDQRPYRGVRGGGITVLQRDVYLDCPLDPQFKGWGQEDESWGLALTELHGRPWRSPSPLWHLWHPPQQRMSRRYGSVAGRQHASRYRKAAHDQAAMRALIDEVKQLEHPNLDQQAVFARAA